MKISTKGRYALRMMLDLAQNQNGGYVSLKDIAQRQGVSKKYLEQIIPLLHKADILKSGRGYQGGYMLSKQPAEYRIGDILRVTEGSLAPVSCMEDSPNRCERSGDCPTLFIWEGLNDVIANYLNSLTLQDILDQQATKE